MITHNSKRYISLTISSYCSAPSSPLSVKTTSINGSTILVSWNPLSPVEARGFVRYYLVTWTPSKARGSPGSANLTADITMYLITDLDPMVSYTISVTPGTSAGVGTASNTTVVTPGKTLLCVYVKDVCCLINLVFSPTISDTFNDFTAWVIII